MTTLGARTVNDFYTVNELQEALRETEPGWCDTSNSSDEMIMSLPSLNLDEEAKRLMVLKSYGILENDLCDQSFDGYTNLAQEVFDVPMSMICLVDMDLIWIKSAGGIFHKQMKIPRSEGLCSHVLSQKQGNGMLIINDTLADSRFRFHPEVTGGQKVRFYAGTPLVTPEGQKIGVLSIADTMPRPKGLTYSQQKRLRDMATTAVYDIIMFASDL